VYVNPAAPAGASPAPRCRRSTGRQPVRRQQPVVRLRRQRHVRDRWRAGDLAQFAAALSGGDTVSGTFATNPALSSSFNLVDSNPQAATSVSAAAGTEQNRNDITVTVAFPTGQNLDSVVIQRAPVTGLNARADHG
jgi:hypothetical protein